MAMIYQAFLLKKEELERIRTIMDFLGFRSKSDYFRVCVLNPPLELVSLDKYKRDSKAG